jgi:hypothetical protein
MTNKLSRALGLQLLLAGAFTLLYMLVVNTVTQRSADAFRGDFHRALAGLALQADDATRGLHEAEKLLSQMQLELDLWIVGPSGLTLATNTQGEPPPVLTMAPSQSPRGDLRSTTVNSVLGPSISVVQAAGGDGRTVLLRDHKRGYVMRSGDVPVYCC